VSGKVLGDAIEEAIIESVDDWSQICDECNEFVTVFAVVDIAEWVFDQLREADLLTDLELAWPEDEMIERLTNIAAR
jgi:hypothetical protein